MHPNSYNLSQFRLIASWIDSKVFVPRFLFSVEQNIYWFKSFLQILTTVSLSHSLYKQAQTVWAKAGGTFLKTYDSAQLPTFQLLRRKTYFLVSRSRRSRDSRSHNVCMYVCLYVCMSQTLIRFKSMNSSVNSFPEWQKLLDIDESD